MVLGKKEILDILIPSESELETWDGDGIYIFCKNGTFKKDKQIGNDSIDLQISNKAYKMNDDYKFINTLCVDSFNKYFEEIPLSIENGYDLKPGEIIFVNTVERVALRGNIMGRVTGRSVFARMGLAVHCTQDKFSSGINSVVGLQLINHSNNVLKIFPYQKLAQMIIQKTGHMDTPYNGIFSREEELKLPQITSKDRSQYSDREISYIDQLKPQKKNILQKNTGTPEKNALFQGVFNVIISLGISLSKLFDKPAFIIAADIFLTILLILANCYFYYISKNKEKK